MKTLLKKFIEAEKRTNRLEKQLESDPCNEELEQRYDKAYQEEFNAYIKLANQIVELTNGKITFDTAKKIIATKRAELMSILELTE